MSCCRHLEWQYFVVLLPARKNRPHREAFALRDSVKPTNFLDMKDVTH